MDLESLRDTPAWEWPEEAGAMLLEVLEGRRTTASDRLLAAELAGEIVAIDDDLVDALLSILEDTTASEELRGRAAISLGPVLELADQDGFDDVDGMTSDVPITERTFHRIQESLAALYRDARVPKDVRRYVLEASVRAPQDWHHDAVSAAYASGDESWKLTAVFAMQYLRGFDKQILEALESSNPQIHLEAVRAAGNGGLKRAWKHVAALITSDGTAKPLLLAAIEAATYIRPRQAPDILGDLADSDDEEISDAALEAMALSEGAPDGDDDD